MAAILARLADLRARREASAARPPAVPPELAAAAAAVGSPTRGTWDADYIQQLRCGEDSHRPTPAPGQIGPCCSASGVEKADDA
jgi:hypothetical protein